MEILPRGMGKTKKKEKRKKENALKNNGGEMSTGNVLAEEHILNILSDHGFCCLSGTFLFKLKTDCFHFLSYGLHDKRKVKVVES